MPWLLALLGPTASGKTTLAEEIADKTGAQLLNADAFQVYRRLDVGTGKSLRAAEYKLINLVDPDVQFGLGLWLRDLELALSELWAQQRSAILVGGTGYYIRAALDGFDQLHPPPSSELRERLNQTPLEDLVTELERRNPTVASIVDLHNRVRVARALERLDTDPIPPPTIPPFSRLKWALDPPDLADRIATRTDQMLAAGWRDEVQSLKASGLTADAPGLRAIGYRTLWDENPEADRAQTRDLIVKLTTQYAKRQRTWLRREQNLVRIAMSERDALIAKLLNNT